MPNTIIGEVSHARGEARPHDLLVIGGGAAGLFCAGIAGQKGLSVGVIDHEARRGEKIRISGGGRCNFTNLEAHRPERFSGADPRFIRTVLRAYPPERFIALIRSHGIDYHEKHKGQLFCDDSAERIIDLLLETCRRGGVREYRPCRVHAIRIEQGSHLPRFVLDTDHGVLRAHRVVVATGGLSIPKIGATDFGYRIARQFGHKVIEPRPALVPLSFDAADWAPWQPLAGVSLPVRVRCDASPEFDDDLLFTHRGLSGPAILQASTFWRPRVSLSIDLTAGDDPMTQLRLERDRGGARHLSTALAQWLPKRLAQHWLAHATRAEIIGDRKLAELGNAALSALAESLSRWAIAPSGTEGFRKAEVTSGGVAVTEIDPRTLESSRQPGLHFIGEVLDVTGWLGGYNFQWAWASAHVVAQAAAALSRSRA